MSGRKGWLTLFLLLVPALARGQGEPSGKCAFDVKAERQGRLMKLPSGQMNGFTGGNVVATCRSQGLVLRSDSLESYGDEGRIVFIGHVDYNERRLKLKADQATYFQRDERLLATQNVVATLPTGSTIRGPQLEFLRAVPRIRPHQSATAIGRPTIDLVQKDAQGGLQPPVKVTGNTVWLQGDSIVSAQGNVVVVRPQLTATGDSLYGDAGSGLLRLMRSPKIVGTKGRPFTLVGETIDLITRKRKLEQVLAKSKAEAQSEDLNLKSDTIDMRVTDDLLQRAIVWGKSRAHLTSPTQSVVADSIDVLLPGQRVRELHAIRSAVAEGTPDTTRFVTTEKDRLTGDTIIARFDTTTTRDTAARPPIERLLAIGHATQLRHSAASDTTICAPQIVYTRGRLIDVRFKHGLIDSIDVVDRLALAGGVQLEPKADSLNRCSVLRPRRVAPVTTVAPARQPAPGQPVPSPAPPAAMPIATPPRRP
jgi:lipopolysaccharide export system protein LptA